MFESQEQEKESMRKGEQGLSDLWNIIKQNNIYIVGDPEGVADNKGTERTLKETMVKNYPNVIKDININIQGVQ